MADVRGFFHRTDDGGARHRARSQLWNPELGADVVEAARTYFEPYVHGLFEDPRASVVAEDGRNYLLGTSERFDVIVADLFMPWKVGVGSLYSLEHYEVARDRLKDGGLYVQWLPLYQMSRKELGVVARTMCEVFALVTLWRGTIAPGWETVALVGHRDAAPLDRDAIERRLAESGNIALREQRVDSGNDADVEVPRLAFRDVLLQYSGNLMAAERLLRTYPVNTGTTVLSSSTTPRSRIGGVGPTRLRGSLGRSSSSFSPSFGSPRRRRTTRTCARCHLRSSATCELASASMSPRCSIMRAMAVERSARWKSSTAFMPLEMLPAVRASSSRTERSSRS